MMPSLQDLLFGSGIIIVIVGAAFYYFKALITETIPLKVSKTKEYLVLASFFVICAGLLAASIYCFSISSVELWFNNLKEYWLWLLPYSIGFILVVILALFLFLKKKLKVYERYKRVFVLGVAGVATFLFLTLFLLLLQYPHQEHPYWVLGTTATILLLFLFLTLLAFYFGRVWNTPPFDVVLHLENDEKLEGKIVETQDKFVKILSSKCLFRWNDVPNNNTELIKFLKDDLKIEVENAKIEKSNAQTITVTNKNNNANLITIKLNKAERKINLEIAEGKTYEYILCDDTIHLVNLDKIKEIEIPQQPN